MESIRGTIILINHIIIAAKSGQRLPQLTIIGFIHFTIHITVSPVQTSTLKSLSLISLCINSVLLILGYTLLILLYRHSIVHIFNRHIPSTFVDILPSFTQHLQLLRPLEIIFRYFTYQYRALPDVIILGEVRCGTTSLCHILSHELTKYGFKVQTPFCLWKHPELDHKETFYFVGHYLGYVTPKRYSMCFPFIRSSCYSKYDDETPCFTFDGCAQYLTSPTTPYLLAQAYYENNQPPPILIACVRNPVEQTISWWNYEMNAMEWGTNSMNLRTARWNTELRSWGYRSSSSSDDDECASIILNYPPNSIKNALAYSMSNYMSNIYNEAEALVSDLSFMDTTVDCCKGYVSNNKEDENTTSNVNNTIKNSKLTINTKANHVKLPPWSITWPGGQLSGIGRNGNFKSNIQRYERVFRSVFGECKIFTSSSINSSASDTKENNHPSYVTVVPLEDMKHDINRKEYILDILSKILQRKQQQQQQQRTQSKYTTSTTECILFEKAIERLRQSHDNIEQSHRNASTKSGENMVHSQNDEVHTLLRRFFSTELKDNK